LAHGRPFLGIKKAQNNYRQITLGARKRAVKRIKKPSLTVKRHGAEKNNNSKEGWN